MIILLISSDLFDSLEVVKEYKHYLNEIIFNIHENN
jgi:hypothetical protein